MTMFYSCTAGNDRCDEGCGVKDGEIICFIGSDHTTLITVKECLVGEGFTFFYKKDVDASYSRFLKNAPSMVIVDIAFNDGAGLDVCRVLRARYNGPILVLLDSDDEMDQVLAFESGADDVAFKPLSNRLLLAHIHALFRRAHRTRSSEPRSITVGEIRVDASRREASINDCTLELTTIQFDLLWFLVKNAGVVVTRDDICHALFNSEYNGVDRSIDVYISRLRQKIGDDPSNPYYLKTVRGERYLFAQ